MTESGCGTVSVFSLSKHPKVLHKSCNAKSEAALACIWSTYVLCGLPTTGTQVRRENVHMSLGENMFPRFFFYFLQIYMFE